MQETLDDEDEDSLPLRELERLWGGACQTCGRPYCGHEAVFSVALGFKDAPRCLPCLALGLRRDPDDLRRELIHYVHRRECFLRAWRVAEEREGTTGQARPTCLDRPALSMTTDEPSSGAESDEALWDAGELACGELVLLLRLRLNKMAPRAVLVVIAHDPAAPVDLPAWCRMTGHSLIRASHPEYVIRRKET